MPASAVRNASLYEETLRVPVRWWLIALVGVAVGGAEVFAGFDWHIALIVYAALGVPVLVLLLGMGHTKVQVDHAGLHAGGRTLAASDIGSAMALDARETRHRLGPGADPAAHIVSRGFIRESVLVRAAGTSDTPYWLVSTRHPDRLLAALSRAGAVTASG
jgi:hypothetical protein